MSRELNPTAHPAALKVLNALPDAVLLTDPELKIIGLNAGAAELLRSDEGSLISQSVEHLASPSSREPLRETVARALNHTGSGTLAHPTELHLLRADGTRFIAEVNAREFKGGSQSTILLSVRDISRQKQIENELRTSEMILAEAQRVAQLGSWRWDITDDRIHWSEQLYRLFGVERTARSLTYSEFLALIHPADRERVNTTISDAAKNQTSFEMEFRIVRPDGTVRLIYSQGAAGFAGTGELASMIGTAQDITERKANETQAFQLALEQAARQEAERTKERFEFLAEVSEALSTSLEYETTLTKLMRLIIPRQADWCSINILESNGTINRLAVAHRNPEKQSILEAIREQGFLPHGDDSHPLTQALYDAKPQLHSTVTDEMLERMARSPEHLELSRELNPTSVMLVPLVARGRAFGIATFGMSDSGRRYTAEDLQLAIEVAHRAAVSIDNAHLYHEAQEAARAREEFVSLVSHELKTPLTVIKGYIQVMERYLEKPNWERDRIRTTRERLSTQVERLELLVADILDVSRMQRGRLDLNITPDTDLVELAKQVMERFDDAIERLPSHEMTIHALQPVVGCWDPLRLDQVFSNLLSNALKYSPEGGPIQVSIWQEDGDACVEIQDSGVGISQSEQETLFQPFQRGAVSSRGTSGTGLGLYITRQIIEQHGGQISVKSTPGDSTTFIFRLPLQVEVASSVE